MGPMRRRDLAIAVLVTAVFSYLAIQLLYRYFPPVTGWSGLSLLAVAVAETVWGRSVRGRIRDGKIGVGSGRLDPLAVARSVAVARASAWAGAIAVGWWLGVLGYLLPRRTSLRVAAADTPGVLVALLSAAALVVAALWLEHCCKSPGEPGGDAGAPNGSAGE